MLARRPLNIDTALRIYYENVEIGSKEIRELFGITANSAVARVKNEVLEEMAKRGQKPYARYCINTAVAYDVWGIDVNDLEKRRNKLKKLALD